MIHWYVGMAMPQRTLAIVPHNGYNSGKCGLLEEKVWLTCLDRLYEETEGVNFIPIRFSYCTGQKQKKSNYYLDGFRVVVENALGFVGVITMAVQVVFPTDQV